MMGSWIHGFQIILSTGGRSRISFPTRPRRGEQAAVAFHLMTSAVKSADRGKFERSPEARRISEQTVDKRSQRRAAGKNQ